MKCNVDVVRIRENSIQLNGWAIGKTPETEITYQVEDGAHQPIRFQYVATRRDDVSQIYFGRTVEKELGFDIQFPYERGKDYYLIAKGEGRKIRIKYNEELIRKRSSVAHKRMQKIRDLMNMETVRVCLDFWKENGLKALLVKSKHKLQGIDNDYDYGEWYSLTKPTAEELEELRPDIEDMFECLKDAGFGHGISAPQIGIKKRLICLDLDGVRRVIVNPTLELVGSEMMELMDDCLCFPGLLVKVRRNRRCIVRYRDENWQVQELACEGYLSELIQHEYDHLNGILATMRAVDGKAFVMKT